MQSTIPILVLRLEGVLQSWGEHSKWDYRDSAIFPTKSGIIGMIGCAMGLEREEKKLQDLSDDLKIAVRADRIGREITDFQTVQSMNLLTAQGKHRGKQGEYSTLVTHRTYLQDSFFTVVITGEKDILKEIECALWHPKWPIYLGRKNCVPSRPVCDGLLEKYSSLEKAIFDIPLAKSHLYDESDFVLYETEEFEKKEQYGNFIERQDMIAGSRSFRTRWVVRKSIKRGEISDSKQIQF